MPRQADPATPEELAERIAKLPAWARKHIEAREELIRLLGGQVASLQGSQPPPGPSGKFPGFHVWHGPHSESAGAEVLVIESEGPRPLVIRPVACNEIIIARGLTRMNIQDAEKAVENIRQLAAYDDESAHGEEDDLYVRVLASIADGTADDPAGLAAAAALKANDISYSRWYA